MGLEDESAHGACRGARPEYFYLVGGRAARQSLAFAAKENPGWGLKGHSQFRGHGPGCRIATSGISPMGRRRAGRTMDMLVTLELAHRLREQAYETCWAQYAERMLEAARDLEKFAYQNEAVITALVQQSR